MTTLCNCTCSRRVRRRGNRPFRDAAGADGGARRRRQRRQCAARRSAIAAAGGVVSLAARGSSVSAAPRESRTSSIRAPLWPANTASGRATRSGSHRSAPATQITPISTTRAAMLHQQRVQSRRSPARRCSRGTAGRLGDVSNLTRGMETIQFSLFKMLHYHLPDRMLHGSSRSRATGTARVCSRKSSRTISKLRDTALNDSVDQSGLVCFDVKFARYRSVP
jgi:hypothetical protein